LSSGFVDQQPKLMGRMIEVAIGLAVCTPLNLLVIPPLRDQQASRLADSPNRRIGGNLIRMTQAIATDRDSDRAEAWFQETESMSTELDSAWRTVRFARESERVNPRSGLRRLRERAADRSQSVSYENILARVDEGVSHLRHLARTLREASYVDSGWDARFREGWVQIVRDAGHAIENPDAEVEPVRDRLDRLAADLADERQLPSRSWPLYGSLIASMRHIAVIVDDVASARGARDGTAQNPSTGTAPSD